MNKIQEKDTLYRLTHVYTNWRFHHAYRHIQYVGRENVPTDGAIIYAPNHCNALQDALAVLNIDDKAKVFMARADIFRKPRQAAILRRLKIMPIARIRDGVDALKQDSKQFEEAADVLRDNVPLCILPEGTHRTKHSLLPLVKGIFRIAWMVNEQLAGEKPVYIVPVGLEYGSYFRFRSSLLVNIGKPINVSEFIAEHPDFTQPQVYSALLEKLTEALRGQILWIPDDEHYDATLESVYLYSHSKGTLFDRLQEDKHVVENVRRMRYESPEKAEAIRQEIEELAKQRREQRICVNSIQTNHLGLHILSRSLFLLVCLPYFLACAAVTLPVWMVQALWLRKLKDPAFYNSFRFVLGLILVPLSYLIAIVLLFVFLPWYWALGAIIALLPANIITHEYTRQWRLLRSDVKLFFNKDLRNKINNLKHRKE